MNFPALHGRPARGWVNDPNGLAFVDGRWHVFFQHNPDAPVHADVAWGHVSSADLVTWREEPVALRPQPGGPDRAGCWTGCVTVDDGVPTAVYSGVADFSGASSALLARSHDALRTWTQDPRPAAGMPSGLAVTDVRDPFVVSLPGGRFVLQGAGSRGGTPSLLVYDAGDLATWKLLGTFLDGDDPVAAEVAPADIWECPNLVRLGDHWLLVVSLWQDAELTGVRWFAGDLDLGGPAPRFVPSHGGRLDGRPAFYAPQLLAAPDGRVLMWGWAWELDRNEAGVAAAGWAGCLTFPRELAWEGESLVSTPARELADLRREPLEGGDLPDAFEVLLPDGPGVLWLDDEEIARWTVSDPATTPRLLVDGSMVEVFPGGPESWTTRAYPGDGGRWRVEVDGLVEGWALGLPEVR